MIILAGFSAFSPLHFVRKYRGRMMIFIQHSSVVRGAHQCVTLNHGVKVTVHSALVCEEVDGGPIIAQVPLSISNENENNYCNAFINWTSIIIHALSSRWFGRVTVKEKGFPKMKIQKVFARKMDHAVFRPSRSTLC